MNHLLACWLHHPVLILPAPVYTTPVLTVEVWG